MAINFYKIFMNISDQKAKSARFHESEAQEWAGTQAEWDASVENVALEMKESRIFAHCAKHLRAAGWE